MPIYEYKCKGCGTEFEKLVKNSEEKVQCVKCSKTKVERKLSVFSASVSEASSCPTKAQCPAAASCSCSKGACGH